MRIVYCIPAGLVALLSLLHGQPASAAANDAMADFPGGKYVANPIGRTAGVHQECVRSVTDLVLGKRPLRGCRVNRISTDANQSVFTWKCTGNASGRTSIRRDSVGVYTVHLQGVDADLPFAEHAEWRRIGEC
jgi:hypothetical protein